MLLPIVATLLLAAPAQASPAAPGEGESQLAEAHAAFDALEMERAAGILEPLVASPEVDDDLRARAWLALGLTRASLLDTDGARAAFTAALAIDASLAPPPGTSPKVTALFDKTRAALGIDVRPGAPPNVRAPEASPSGGATAPPNRGAPATTRPPRANAQGAPGEPGMGRAPWLAAGGALLAGGVLAAGAAVLADGDLGRPVAGRTRADYEGVRSVGIAALGTAAALLVSGGLVVGAAFSLVEEP